MKKFLFMLCFTAISFAVEAKNDVIKTTEITKENKIQSYSYKVVDFEGGCTCIAVLNGVTYAAYASTCAEACGKVKAILRAIK
jgi:hypothetical protein